ncbi:hypothetical protein [Cellulosimicrobium cellulans]|uniref:DUF4365 domain-containing protein n=1 Tax=Cellulosimicrobium cellulans TaxID=1710 RepID=A0A4Y4DRM7_CELCE|nr:hypothetical protein [Cellulosimicrobium cellulans]GED08002.1 hypothetical protein CCE02nite_00010 [Cellulosimicrobium cellulans]
MSTETRAVGDMMSLFSRCLLLDPVFATHDKVLLTDGHIEIYSSGEWSKETWRGRVNAQVKGRKGKKKPTLSFSLERIVLEAHMGNNGLLLLCVDYHPSNGKGRPLYAALTPFTIRRVLEGIPAGQKSVAVRLTKLPRDPADLERIVEVVHRGSRQNPFARTDPSLFETVTSMVVATVEHVDFTVPTHLRIGESAFAIEVTTKDGSQVPLDGDFDIVPGDYVERTVELQVVAGRAVFESFTVQRTAPDQTLIKLDDSLSMVLREDPGRQVATFNFTYPSNFAARKRALEFIVGIADSGQISFGDRAVSIGRRDSATPLDLDDMRQHLAYLRRMQELFDRLAINCALIDMDTLTDQHIQSLNVLHSVFINGVAAGNPDGTPGRVLVNIGPWAVMLVVAQGEEGAWQYIDPFNPDSPRMFRWVAQDEREVTIPVTAYDVVEAEHLPRVLNLRLEAIDSAYESIADAERTTAVANQCMRDLLDRFDAGGPRRDEFLRGADRLNEWIIRHDGAGDAHMINRWQIAWRRGDLASAERSKIRAMKRTSAQSDDEMSVQRELACALLLEEREEAQFLSSQLPDDARAMMQEWPIWKLYRQLVDQASPDADGEPERDEKAVTA